MSQQLTTAEKISRLHWNTGLNAFNTVFAQLTFFGSAFALFLNELKLSNTHIGFLFSLIPFTGLIALFIAPSVARFGYKRTWVTFFGLRKVATAALLLVPTILNEFGYDIMVVYVTVSVAVFALVRSIAEMAIIPWAQEFIPNSIRGRYAAVNDMISRVVGIGAIAFAGFVLSWPTGLDRFMVLFAVALVFGVIAVWSSSHIPGGAPIKESDGERISSRHLFRVLRDRNFVLYMIALSLITIGTGPMGSFLPLYMEREVGLSESMVVMLQIGSLLGGLTSTYLVGWAADRYGSKPIMLSGLYIKALLPLAWLLMPRYADSSLPVALAISFVAGIAEIAWAIGVIRLLYVSVVPYEKKTEYMAMYYALIGLVGGTSQVLGGRLLDLAGGLSGQFFIFTLDPFFPLFVIGLIFTVVSLVLFNRVRADSSVSVGEFAGMFMHGNPILALESMFRYYRAKDERATVVMTERMGQTKSPLTVDELLEALKDPRFNVRFEAIISIARMNSDPRLVEALCHILDGTELSLSVVAAWALGRIGDEQALFTLRKGLNSEYRSIRAHCARALGTLGDAEMIPVLCERLNTESDKGLQMAYASALGNLRAAEALDTLFRILVMTQNEGARLELALAIARIVGPEQYFIRLVRQMRQDRATAMAQSITALKKRFEGDYLSNREQSAILKELITVFARDDFEHGIPLLVQLIHQRLGNIVDGVKRKVLEECAARLEEFGSLHMEYVILGLHTLDVS